MQIGDTVYHGTKRMHIVRMDSSSFILCGWMENGKEREAAYPWDELRTKPPEPEPVAVGAPAVVDESRHDKGKRK